MTKVTPDIPTESSDVVAEGPPAAPDSKVVPKPGAAEREIVPAAPEAQESKPREDSFGWVLWPLGFLWHKPVLRSGLVVVLFSALLAYFYSKAKPLPALEPANNEEGILLDRETDLMWARTDNRTDIDWTSADAYCEKLPLGGYSDWRLPTIDELETLYDPNVDARLKIRSPLKLTACCPWSSDKEGSDSAWHFNFPYGTRYHFRLDFSDVRRALCVRRSGE